jgi:predicted nucleic acid-binding protein
MRTFFDTNILVYLFDADADEKKAQATARFETEVAAGRALLSTQVLQEFYVVVTRKLWCRWNQKRPQRSSATFPCCQSLTSILEQSLLPLAGAKKRNYHFGMH